MGTRSGVASRGVSSGETRSSVETGDRVHFENRRGTILDVDDDGIAEVRWDTGGVISVPEEDLTPDPDYRPTIKEELRRIRNFKDPLNVSGGMPSLVTGRILEENKNLWDYLQFTEDYEPYDEGDWSVGMGSSPPSGYAEVKLGVKSKDIDKMIKALAKDSGIYEIHVENAAVDMDKLPDRVVLKSWVPRETEAELRKRLGNTVTITAEYGWTRKDMDEIRMRQGDLKGALHRFKAPGKVLGGSVPTRKTLDRVLKALEKRVGAWEGGDVTMEYNEDGHMTLNLFVYPVKKHTAILAQEMDKALFGKTDVDTTHKAHNVEFLLKDGRKTAGDYDHNVSVEKGVPTILDAETHRRVGMEKTVEKMGRPILFVKWHWTAKDAVFQDDDGNDVRSGVEYLTGF